MTAAILLALFSGMVALGLQLSILAVRAALEDAAEAQESACAMSSRDGPEGESSGESHRTNASKLSDIK